LLVLHLWELPVGDRHLEQNLDRIRLAQIADALSALHSRHGS
jgi:hypothetical protein